MIKKFLNVFKINKSKLTMEELQICLKIQHVSIITAIISLIIMMVMITLNSKNIFFGCVGVVAAVMFCISLSVIVYSGDLYRDIQKLEDAKNNDLKAKSIVTQIKEGKFDGIYCKDKDVNKLLFDICLEKGNIEISIKQGNIVVRTVDETEIPLKVENVNDYFEMY